MKKRIQKRRQKAPTTKVIRKQRRSIKIAPKINGISPSLLWNNSRTNTENYSTLGIVSSLNKSLHQKPTKYTINDMMNTMFPSKPSREHEIFDTSEFECVSSSIKSLFQESFKMSLSNDDVQGSARQSQLIEFFPEQKEPVKIRKPVKRLSSSIQKYMEKLVILHGDSQESTKVLLNISLLVNAERY